eukprot:TRINITY_DN15923_c0_g1_i1.p1 TRINITY_DN15923_c0_g1~~TRINITY_DN15923_c0_g1_i1.p1  ORF type:complete len:156 (-),score=33.15 TRINITY_DN15923_c0_g1_i1:101-568(-)
MNLNILRPSLVLLVILLTNQSSCSLNRLKLAFQKSAGESNVNQQTFDNELPENEDWPNYAPYFRFAGKRSSFNRHLMAENECDIHKHTLAELYEIVKEEADIFEQCLDHQDGNSLMKHVGISPCDVHRHTLAELFEIVKEEAEIYENCLATNNKD